jgi:hypothetical protein
MKRHYSAISLERMRKHLHPVWALDSLVSKLSRPSESVVVTGFWRSGTTWLLESIADSLCAKSVFEPLWTGIRDYNKLLRNIKVDIPKREGNIFMPSVPTKSEDRKKLQRYLKRALTSDLPGHWIRKSRKPNRAIAKIKNSSLVDRPWSRLRSAANRRIVTKLVRGHLIAPLIKDEFNSTVIHIRRPVSEVVESFHKRFNYFGVWRNMSLEDQLLNYQLRENIFFSKWKDKIKRIDKEDVNCKIAALWIIYEMYVNLNKDKFDNIIYFKDLQDQCRFEIEGKRINMLKTRSSSSIGEKYARKNPEDICIEEILESINMASRILGVNIKKVYGKS